MPAGSPVCCVVASLSRAASRMAATQYSCTETSISSVCASVGTRGGVHDALGAPDRDVGVGEQFVHERLRGRLELIGRRRRG